ncbi:peptidase_M11 domain-containing protein, partial [Haematococcus lacustris]
FESILPGTLLRVFARDLGPNALLVLQFLVITPVQDGSSPGSSSQAGSWDDQSSSGSSSASARFSVAALAGDLAAGSPWVQNTAVTSVPTLFMIAGMCDSPAATVPSVRAANTWYTQQWHGGACAWCTSLHWHPLHMRHLLPARKQWQCLHTVNAQELEKVLFNVPGSRAKTLQSYYSECSQGMASLNSTNSRVVGPITIPCSYSSDSLSFSTESCEYSDTDGWIQYASQQAALDGAGHSGTRCHRTQWRCVDHWGVLEAGDGLHARAGPHKLPSPQ